MWSLKYHIYLLLSGLSILQFTNAALMSSQTSQNTDEAAPQDNAEVSTPPPAASGPLTEAQWKQHLGEQVVAEREKLRNTIIEGYYNVTIRFKTAMLEVYQLLLDDEKMWSEMVDDKRRDALRNIHIEFKKILQPSELISLECFAENNGTTSPEYEELQMRYTTMLGDGSFESWKIMTKMNAYGFNLIIENAHIFIMHFWMRTYPLFDTYYAALKAYHGYLWHKDEFKNWLDLYTMTRLDKIIEMMKAIPARKLTP